MTKYLRLLAAAVFSATAYTAATQAPVREAFNPLADEQMMRLDSLMTVFHDKHTTFKDDISKMNVYGFDTNDIPTYPADVIQYRLNRMESPIPMEYNQYVKGYIDLYSIRKKKLTTHILTWSQYYFPLFEQILDQQGLPLEFKYLAVIESALNPHAQSWCGATGLWQFMYGTGLMYGLKINSFVDERKDPIKATYAACQYFKDMYALYGDWLLVIAAYNCGPGNVNRAIRKSGGHYNFWKIMPYLPVETRGYVPAFIGASYVMNYHKEHNLYPNPTVVNYVTDTVHVDNRLSFYQLSQSLQMNEEEIKLLNPSYKQSMLPYPTNAKSCVLRLPYQKCMSFTDLKENIYTSTSQFLNNPYAALPASNLARNACETGTQGQTISLPKTVRYKVKRGEGLYSIAYKYGCTVQDIKRLNGLHGNALSTGQTITVQNNRM